MKTIFTGSAVALVTPFTENGVNIPELKRLIDFQIDNGTDAVVLCGTTGEPATMTDDERSAVIDEGIKHIAGRVPVIVGTGSNCTAHAAELSKRAQASGADAVLVVTPYYNKCSQEGLKRHYLTVADAIDIPIIMYNVPSRTGVNVQASTLGEIAKHENIAAMKEASGDISLVAEMSRVAGDKLTLYSGNDDQVIPLMSLGGKGVISVLANIAPRLTHDMVQAFSDGDTAKAAQMQLDLKPLIDVLFCEVNPIPVKAALNMMGFAAGPLRLPLCEPSDANKAKIKAMLKEYKLI